MSEEHLTPQNIADDEADDHTDEHDLDEDAEDTRASEAQADREDPEASDDDEDPDLAGDDDIQVTLPDGRTVTQDALTDAYLEIEGKSEAFVADQERFGHMQESFGKDVQALEGAFQNLVSFAERMIPPEPDLSLARSDPGSYQMQAAVRQRSIHELQQLFAGREALEEELASSGAEHEKSWRDEQEKILTRALPELSSPTRRSTFNAKISHTARSFGFSPEEIGQTADARVLQLVHYAGLGRDAESARGKVERSTPARRGPRPRVTTNRGRSRSAMKQLMKSGSLQDAMSVDFH